MKDRSIRADRFCFLTACGRNDEHLTFIECCNYLGTCPSKFHSIMQRYGIQYYDIEGHEDYVFKRSDLDKAVESNKALGSISGKLTIDIDDIIQSVAEQDPEFKKYLSKDEAAEFLGCDTEYISELQMKGQFIMIVHDWLNFLYCKKELIELKGKMIIPQKYKIKRKS